jgi:hypothetical protein
MPDRHHPSLPAGLIEARRQAAERRTRAAALMAPRLAAQQEFRDRNAAGTFAELECLRLTGTGVAQLLRELEAKAKAATPPEVTTDTN